MYTRYTRYKRFLSRRNSKLTSAGVDWVKLAMSNYPIEIGLVIFDCDYSYYLGDCYRLIGFMPKVEWPIIFSRMSSVLAKERLAKILRRGCYG